MTGRGTLLRALLRRRHWQTYSTFCRRYDETARQIDPVLVGRWPSRGQYARWLSGDLKGLPHPDHCRILEAMFPGTPVERLFGRADEDPAGIPEQHTPQAPPAPAVVRPAPTEHRGRGARVPTQAGPSDVVVGVAGPADTTVGPADTTVGPACGAGPADPAQELVMTTEESARFVRTGQGGVDTEVLDQVAADVRQLAVDYLARPPLAVVRPLARLRREVFDMLERRQRPTVLPALYSAAGRLCALLAHAGADLGHTYAAHTHTRTAWLCADLADDDRLRGYVRWVQSNVAYWEGDPRRAADLAAAGRRHATRGAGLVRLASQEARAWAAVGDRREVDRALSLVHQARDADHPDDEAGVFRFDPGKAAYYESEVRLALGGTDGPRLAERAALESLELLAAAPEAHRSPEFDAAARLDLGNARLAGGDLDGAAEALRVVLRLPVESRTQPIVGRVAAADAALAAPRIAGAPLAMELQEEIALFRAYPARRDLPEGSA